VTRITGDGRDEEYMRLALERAAAAAAHDDVPIGAVVVRDGEVIGAAGNERELRQDPTAHAECLAIRAASLTLRGWRLVGAELYCTLEPCPMCAGAIQQARIARVIYGAPDQKIGAAGTVIDLLRSPRMLQRVQVTPGVLATESQELLRSFFASRR
jgi:tRNA(adenine34) deaminase